MPKLAGKRGQCPRAPGGPTLHDQLHFCGALMGFAAFLLSRGDPVIPQ